MTEVKQMTRNRAIDILEKIAEHYEVFNTRYYIDDLQKYFNCTIFELLDNADYYEKIKDGCNTHYILDIDNASAKIFI